MQILSLANKSDFRKRRSSEDEKEWGGDSVCPVVTLGHILFFNFKWGLQGLCTDM